jgi:hypothetical protein
VKKYLIPDFWKMPCFGQPIPIEREKGFDKQAFPLMGDFVSIL